MEPTKALKRANKFYEKVSKETQPNVYAGRFIELKYLRKLIRLMSKTRSENGDKVTHLAFLPSIEEEGDDYHVEILPICKVPRKKEYHFLQKTEGDKVLDGYLFGEGFNNEGGPGGPGAAITPPPPPPPQG